MGQTLVNFSKFNFFRKRKSQTIEKSFSFNNYACRVFRTNLVLVWFECCPSYHSRKKWISGTFISLASASSHGFKNFSLSSLFLTLVTWTTLKLDEDKFVLRLGCSTIIETKYYSSPYKRNILPHLYTLILIKENLFAIT